MKDVFRRLGSDFLSTIVFLVIYLATDNVILATAVAIAGAMHDLHRLALTVVLVNEGALVVAGNQHPLHALQQSARVLGDRREAGGQRRHRRERGCASAWHR